MEYTLGRPSWLEACIAEQLAVRHGVGILDQTSFGKLRLA
jgi:4-methylaminobutanoate oxidase (formaldehyde-forming)